MLGRSNALLNLWTGDLGDLAYNITLNGTNEVVLSAPWYLPSGAKSYSADPQSVCPKCSAEQRSRIVGGEACQWGEGVRPFGDATIRLYCLDPTSVLHSHTFASRTRFMWAKIIYLLTCTHTHTHMATGNSSY